ncbi:methyltransferase tdiE like protein [Verticillium longisporum]|nr:methyltransferase tdiE like protein [Verticillium longisporum]
MGVRDERYRQGLKDSDLQHELFRRMFNGRLGLAPPDNPNYEAEHVLDVGTGTGICAIEYGGEHPEAKVIGTDLSPSQPSWLPPNLDKCFRSLAPGDCVEVQEIDLNAKSDDGTLREDSHLSRRLKLLGEATVLLGRQYQDIQQIKDIMADVGFSDVTDKYFMWPTNRILGRKTQNTKLLASAIMLI